MGLVCDLFFYNTCLLYTSIYYEEFWKDILKQLEACVKQAEAINDKYEGTTDRRTARILSELSLIHI